jgi:hypothetical protein
MKLMRHSDMKLTAKVYTDETQLPIYEAIKGLPRLLDHTQIRAQISGAGGQNVARAGAASEGNGHAKTPVNGGVCRALAQADAMGQMERAKGFESIRDHRPVSSETGVISHKSTCNTRFAFCPARSKTTFLRRGFVIRSHASARNKTPLTRGKLLQLSVTVLARLEAVPEFRGEPDLGAINQGVAIFLLK